MKYLNSALFVLLLAISIISFSACFSDGSADGEDGDAESTDGDSDNEDREQAQPDGDENEADGDVDEDAAEEESEAEAEPESEAEPEELAVKSAKATDDTHVSVVYNKAVDINYAEEGLQYSIKSENNRDLDIKSISYDAISKTVTLRTEDQKLGQTYTLEIDDPYNSAVDFENEFVAADNHTFWVADFSSQYYEMEELDARRAGVGENCVVYVEQGYNMAGLSNVIKEFDDKIFPIETTSLIEAPDLDENGRITILFLNGGSYYGGYYTPINTIPDEQAMEYWGIHSNGMELIHINVLSDEESVTYIVAHEFQHLLYQERHGFTEENWDYHNEGLAESAVHMVYGESAENLNFYIYDPRDIIRKGLSLVNWTYAQYENYVLAYLFWTYLTGQLTGNTDGYIDVFNLDTGSPREVEQFIQERLGISFMQAHLNSIVAFWAQHDEGQYSFNGMIDMVPGYSPLVSAGTTSLSLEPFTGAVFRYNTAEISYPETAGENIRYVGVNTDYEVDTEEPFSVGGGVLVAYNANFATYAQWQKEHSGPDIAAVSDKRSAALDANKENVCKVENIPAWADPPPINPDKPEQWTRWLEATERRIAAE